MDKMKLIKILPFVLLLLISASFAAAQTSDPAPVVGITAQPGTLVWNSATVRVSATDRWPNAAISHIDFYVNGTYSSTHNCGFQQSCIYTTSRVSGVQKNETYYAIVHDLSNTVQTQNLTVIFKGPNRPPDLSGLPNKNISEDSGNNVNLTDLWANVTDDWTNSSNLTYNIANQSNTTPANCTVTNNRYIDCATITQDAFGTSVIIVAASDGQLTGTGNFTLTVFPVNDAPVFNTTIPAITFAEDTSHTFNISDYFYDVDNLVSAFSFLPASIGNITITYAYNNTLNKIQATLTPAQDWNGAVTTNFTASDGMNTSGASNNVLITVTNVNDRPIITGTPPVGAWKDVPFSYQFNASDIDTGDTLTFYDNTSLFNIDPSSGWVNFTPVNTSTNTILITVCDDSGAADNCTNTTWNFNIYNYPPIQFSNIYANPASPAAYTENSTTRFSATVLAQTNNSILLIQNATIHAVWIEFNGTNYTVNTSGSTNYFDVANLSTGNYTFRWHANYTNGMQYNTNRHNYTVNKGNYEIGITTPAPITYGTPANVSCSASVSEVTPVLMRNRTVVSNPDNAGLLGAGTYTYFCYANATPNFNAMNISANYTVNPLQVTVNLSLQTPITYGTAANVSCNASPSNITPILTRNGVALSGLTDTSVLGAGTYNYTCYYNATQNYTGANASGTVIFNPVQVNINLSLQSPITYGTAANVSCNASPSNITPILTRNGVALSGLTDTSVLGAGNYNYSCFYNATQNYTGANATQTLIVNKAQAVVNLTLNGTDGDISLPINGSVLNITVTPIIPTTGMLELWINGTIAAQTNNSLSILYNFTGPGTYHVRGVLYPSSNYTIESESHSVYVAVALAKMNINPQNNSSINKSSLMMSFNTNKNTSCRWSLNDTAYSNMSNDFATTGQTNHSGNITGLTLGNKGVYIACINETAGSNTNLNYFVQNIIEQGSTLTNGAAANNSRLYSTSVDNSTLQSVNATGSTIRGSILANCSVINSTVKNYQGTNCVIINSFVDPPNPGSDLTGSTITGNSKVMNSNATYSTVNNSNITNSNVNNSQITTSEITSSNVQSCNITGSQLSGGVTCNNSTVSGSTLYNITIINAVVNNGVLTNGTMTYNGTNYPAPQNISNITNLPPNSAFTYSRSNLQVSFNAGSSSDPNTGDTLTYFWNWGDGTNTTTTSATRSHTYSSAGTYNVTLTATDNLGASDPTPDVQQITVTAGSGSGGNTPVRIYGGGGGGGGSSIYARNWKIDLDERSPDIKTLSRRDTAVITLNNATYTLRMDSIDRKQVNFTLKDIPYSLINYEIKKIDLDSDGISELRIIIMSNYYTRAQMRFDKFEEKMRTTAPPLIFSNISMGIEDNTTEPPVQEKEKEKGKESKIKQTITKEQNETVTNQITGEATGNWLDNIPKDSQTIGIGITIGVVIAGLIVYFVASAIML
ncbi:PKD domain-containing protein [Candidatus Woesearchaeota archaeon]|nr:PKD domain-containing protein [Candidatus Woesearchaeota archaeon]